MKTLVIGNLVNLALDPLLIFGPSPFPVLVITVLTFAIMIPAAIIMALKLGWGTKGIWLGILASQIVAGLAAQLWFQKTLKHAERLHILNSNAPPTIIAE